MKKLLLLTALTVMTFPAVGSAQNTVENSGFGESFSNQGHAGFDNPQSVGDMPVATAEQLQELLAIEPAAGAPQSDDVMDGVVDGVEGEVMNTLPDAEYPEMNMQEFMRGAPASAAGIDN
jgi:hypothetical protein